MKWLLLNNLIIPVVLLVLGGVLKLHPFQTIGSNGYSTPASRRSQECWDYAQRVAPDVFLKWGRQLLIAVVCMDILFLFLPISIGVEVGIGMGFGFICMLSGFVEVEKNLREAFPED